eukprot:gene16489-22715_t
MSFSTKSVSTSNSKTLSAGARTLSTKPVAIPPSAPSQRLSVPLKAAMSNSIDVSRFHRAQHLQPDTATRVSLMDKLSEAVEIDAAVARFEVFAGRSSMIAFVVIMLDEWATKSSILSMSMAEAEVLTSLFALVLTGTVSLAAARSAGSSRSKLGMLLRPEVVAVLTSQISPSCDGSNMDVGEAVDKYLDGGFVKCQLLSHRADVSDEEFETA